jgi:hypothetical protein
VLFELGRRKAQVGMAYRPDWRLMKRLAYYGRLLGSVLPDRDSIVDTQGGVSLIEDATTKVFMTF